MNEPADHSASVLGAQKKKDLSIRSKIILMVIVGTVALSTFMYVISKQVLFKSYLAIEQTATIENIQRAKDAIDNSVLQLSIKLKDWASWNDTYAFIEDGNEAYIKSNLTNGAISNLLMNSMVFVDVRGDILFKKSINFETRETIDASSLGEHVLTHKKLTTHSTLDSFVAGIISLPEGPFLIASRPVLTSDGQGPIHGSLIFGKFLDDQGVKDVADLTHLSIALFPYASSTLADDVLVAKQKLTQENKYYVQVLSETVVAGYTVVFDLYGEPISILRIDTPRPVYNQGNLTFNLLILIAVVVFVFLGLITYILVESLIVGRLSRLSKEVLSIGASQDLSQKVHVGKIDEVGRMAETINTFISALSAARSKENEKTLELEQSVRELERSKKAIFNLLEDIEAEKKMVDGVVVLRTKELSEEKARLLASINSLSFGFVLVDKDDNILIKNPAVAAILDTIADLKTLADIQKNFNNLNLVASCKECNATKRAVEHKEVVYGKRYLRVFCAPVSEGDEVIGSVILVEDITEAKVMERSRDEFFSIASHELRTPLTAIRGNADMMLDLFGDKIPDKDMKDMLVDIDASSVRLIAIVNDFLEVSRLEQGKIDIKKENVDIGATVQKVLKNLKNSSQNDTALAFDPSVSPIPTAYTDPARLEEVLLNLIGNSMKFTKNGSITVSLEAIPNFVKVRVADTGIGISEQNQALLFRKFQQAGKDTIARDVTQGTGLGLYICRLIISALGGTIGLEKSEPGKGSTFAFTVPIR